MTYQSPNKEKGKSTKGEKVEMVKVSTGKNTKKLIKIVSVVMAMILTFTGVNYIFADEVQPAETTTVVSTPVSYTGENVDLSTKTETVVEENKSTLIITATPKEGYTVKSIAIPQLELIRTENPASFEVTKNGEYEVVVKYTRVTVLPTVSSEVTAEPIEEVSPEAEVPTPEAEAVTPEVQEEAPVVEPAAPVEEVVPEVQSEPAPQVEEPVVTEEEPVVFSFFYDVQAEEAAEEYTETFTIVVDSVEVTNEVATASVDDMVPNAVDCLNFLLAQATTPGTKTYNYFKGRTNVNASINNGGANFGQPLCQALVDAGLVGTESAYGFRIYRSKGADSPYEIYWTNNDILAMNVGDPITGWKLTQGGGVVTISTEIYLDGSCKAIHAAAESNIETGADTQHCFVTNNGTITGYDFANCPKDIIIPTNLDGETITGIGGQAFDAAVSADRAITSLQIPSGITSIGAKTFRGNTIVQSALTIPASVTTIGNYAFQSANKNIGRLFIEGATNVTASSFNNGVISNLVIGGAATIGDKAFTSTNMNSVSLGSVTSIGASAFSSNHLMAVNLPESCTSVAANAFVNQTASLDGLTGTTTLANTYVLDLNQIADSVAGFDASKVTSVTGATYDPETGLATFATKPADGSKLVYSYNVANSSVSASMNVTVTVGTFAEEFEEPEEPEILTHTVTYSLGGKGSFGALPTDENHTIDANGNYVITVLDGDTTSLFDLGYYTATLSKTNGFASSGNINYDSGLLAGWADSNGNLINPVAIVPSEDVTYEAVWVLDTNHNGIPDSAEKQIIFVSDDTETLTGAPSVTGSYVSVDSETDTNGKATYTVTVDMAEMNNKGFLASLVNFSSLMSNPTYIATLNNRWTTYLGNLEGTLSVGTVMTALPTTDHTSTLWNGMSAADCLASEVQENPYTITASYVDNRIDVTYDLQGNGTFSDGSTTRVVKVEPGTSLATAGYPLGTTTTGVDSTGDVVSSYGWLYGWKDASGSLINPTTYQPTANETLTPFWFVDADGDGVVDQSVQTYRLTTDDEVTFTSAPTATTYGKVVTTTDEQGHTVYTITVNKMDLGSNSQNVLNSLKQMQGMRTNEIYAERVNGYAQNAINGLTADVTLGQAIGTLPTASGLFGSWSDGTNSYTNEEILGAAPAGEPTTYTAQAIEAEDRITITYSLDGHGTFASTGTDTKAIEVSKNNTQNYLGLGLDYGTMNQDFTTSGSITSSYGALFFYTNEDGSIQNVLDVPVENTTLHAHWLTGETGVQNYVLATNENSSFQTAPTIVPHAGVTLSEQGEGSEKTYTIQVRNIQYALGTSYNQMWGMMALRTNPTYASIIKSRIFEPAYQAENTTMSLGSLVSNLPTIQMNDSTHGTDLGWTNGTETGLTGDAILQATAPLGTTTYTYQAGLQYALDIHYVYPDGTSVDGLTDVHAVQDKGTSYSYASPAKVGYTPANETVAGTLNQDTVVNVVYQPNNGTNYQVELYLEDLTAGSYTKSSTTTLQGQTDTQAVYSPDTQAGYTLDTTQSVLSGNIAGDGSLVLEVYYNRATDLTYTVHYVGLEADGTTVILGTQAETGRLGETVQATPEDFASVGYTFDATATENQLSGEVNAEGTLVLTVNYRRSVYATVTLTDDLGNTVDLSSITDGATLQIKDGANTTTQTIHYSEAQNGITLPTPVHQAGQDIDTVTPWKLEGPDANGVYTIEPVYVYNPKYTIHYDLNGATGTLADKAVTYVDHGLLPTVPSRSGYSFEGWAVDGTVINDLTTYQSLVASDSTLAVTLVAQWTAIPVIENVIPSTTKPVEELAVTAIANEQDAAMIRPIVTEEEAEERIQSVSRGGYPYNEVDDAHSVGATLIQPEYGTTADDKDCILHYGLIGLAILGIVLLVWKNRKDEKEYLALMNEE